MEKAAAKGTDVPALRNRPEIPLWLLPAVDAWVDLSGEVRWASVKDWCEYYGADMEWILPVLRVAERYVDEKMKKDQSVSATRHKANKRSQ